jgi:hypothetical protein
MIATVQEREQCTCMGCNSYVHRRRQKRQGMVTNESPTNLLKKAHNTIILNTPIRKSGRILW